MSKNDWKLIIVGVGTEMSWLEKNRKINNQREGGECVWRLFIIWNSRVYAKLKKKKISLLAQSKKRNYFECKFNAKSSKYELNC